MSTFKYGLDLDQIQLFRILFSSLGTYWLTRGIHYLNLLRWPFCYPVLWIRTADFRILILLFYVSDWQDAKNAYYFLTDPDPGGPKAYGSCGFGSTLLLLSPLVSCEVKISLCCFQLTFAASSIHWFSYFFGGTIHFSYVLSLINPFSVQFQLICLLLLLVALKSLVSWPLFQCLKGQCHEIFRFWFFSSISFPPAPEYPIRTVSIFFENSRRYSQLKVDHRCRWHRWQMRKTFNQKNCNNIVGTPLDSRVNTYIHFCLQVQFKVSAAWY